MIRIRASINPFHLIDEMLSYGHIVKRTLARRLVTGKDEHFLSDRVGQRERRRIALTRDPRGEMHIHSLIHIEHHHYVATEMNESEVIRPNPFNFRRRGRHGNERCLLRQIARSPSKQRCDVAADISAFARDFFRAESPQPSPSFEVMLRKATRRKIHELVREPSPPSPPIIASAPNASRIAARSSGGQT
jgi:hypothetical protein